MTADELKQCTEMLAAYFPNHPWTPTVWLVWSNELGGHDYGDATKAIRHLGTTCEFPSVAKLIEALAVASYRPPSTYQALPEARLPKDQGIAFVNEARRRARQAREESIRNNLELDDRSSTSVDG